MNINKVTLCGRLTKDPELKKLPDGKSVCQFSIATNKKWRDNEGKVNEKVNYQNVVAFSGKADAISTWVKKGDLLYLEGELQTRSYEKDGEKKYVTDVLLNSFEFVPKGEKREAIQPDGTDYPQDDNGAVAAIQNGTHPLPTSDDQFADMTPRNDEVNPEYIPF